jgi:transaldolase
VLYQLESVVGVNLNEISQKLEEEGIQKFIKPFQSLMSVLEEKREEGKES